MTSPAASVEMSRARNPTENVAQASGSGPACRARSQLLCGASTCRRMSSLTAECPESARDADETATPASCATSRIPAACYRRAVQPGCLPSFSRPDRCDSRRGPRDVIALVSVRKGSRDGPPRLQTVSSVPVARTRRRGGIDISSNSTARTPLPICCSRPATVTRSTTRRQERNGPADLCRGVSRNRTGSWRQPIAGPRGGEDVA